jgi:hypothetical protein
MVKLMEMFESRNAKDQSPRGSKLVAARIFCVPKNPVELLKQLILFVVYFFPTIYFVVTGELLFRLF